jgi:hypothetical protein
MTTIYLAAASAEIETAEKYIKALKEIGYGITHDWTVAVRTVGQANPVDMPRMQRAGHAFDDLYGVRVADRFWLLVPKTPGAGSGCWIEFGAALANRQMVVVSGDHKRSIFTALATHVFDEHDQALDFFRAIYT